MRPESSTLTKVCTKCGRLLPVESFYRNRRAKDGRCAHCKECQAERKRRFRQDHPEVVAEREHRYYQKNREAKTERVRLRYENNREVEVERARLYYQANREAVQKHKRLYRKARLEAYRTYDRNREARKKNIPGNHTADDVLAQYARQKGRCYWCKTKVGKDYHVDHVIPLVLGGSNGPENIVVACASCNLSKHAKHPMDFAGRLC